MFPFPHDIFTDNHMLSIMAVPPHVRVLAGIPNDPVCQYMSRISLRTISSLTLTDLEFLQLRNASYKNDLLMNLNLYIDRLDSTKVLHPLELTSHSLISKQKAQFVRLQAGCL